MQTKTIEIMVISYLDHECRLIALKGTSLFNCLSQVTEDIACMVADNELNTIEEILERLDHNNEFGGDDIILYVRDVTNKDYVYVSEYVSVHGNSIKLCKNFDWR